MYKVDISRKDKAEVLLALYKHSKVKSVCSIVSRDLELTLEEARNYINSSRSKYFDYINGKAIKIDLSDNIINAYRYDNDNGEGTALTIIRDLPDII